MIIHYQPNPLNTIVELDDLDLEKLRLKITIEELKERIYGAHFRLEPGDRFDPKEAMKELNVDGLEDEPFKARVNEQIEWCISELKDSHCGDCTCIPCSCMKCRAEYFLGIDTIPHLGKHQASAINGAFSNDRTIDEAIAYLHEHKPVRDGAWLKFPPEDFDRHVPLWMAEGKQAAKWLEDYRLKHFP